jgi:hypothetical protein
MKCQYWFWVPVIVAGSVIPQTSAVLAVRLTYDIDYFLTNSSISNISLPAGSRVGGATFSYDTSNLINFGSLFNGNPIYINAPSQTVDPNDPNVPDFLKVGPPSTQFGQPYNVVDQFSGTLLGTNWSLADRSPASFLIGTQILPSGNVSTFDSVFQGAVSILDPNSSPPSFTQFDYQFNANQWNFTPLRNPNNPAEFLSDPRRIDMVSTGGCADPLSGCRDPFSVRGLWFSQDESIPLAAGYADGFFTTSLRTGVPGVPEPSAEMIEILGGLVLFFGTLGSRWRKKLRA